MSNYPFKKMCAVQLNSRCFFFVKELRLALSKLTLEKKLWGNELWFTGKKKKKMRPLNSRRMHCFYFILVSDQILNQPQQSSQSVTPSLSRFDKNPMWTIGLFWLEIQPHDGTILQIYIEAFLRSLFMVAVDYLPICVIKVHAALSSFRCEWWKATLSYILAAADPVTIAGHGKRN